MRSLRSIYRHPAYYEIGFCTSGARKEADFVSRCFRKHGSRTVVPSVLDNGCGTGLHLEILAKQACRVGGYDAVQEMVEYTGDRLDRITKGHEVFQCDLREFATQRKYDIAICMNGSFQHLFTTEDVLSHLECVAKALKKNGLYLVSLPPPEDFLLNPPGQAKSKWAKNRGGIKVAVDWTCKQQPIDWHTQTFSGLARIQVNDHGRQRSFKLCYRYRLFFLQEIITLARMSGHFQVAAVYADFHLGRIYGKAGRPRVMNVLLRKGLGSP